MNISVSWNVRGNSLAANISKCICINVNRQVSFMESICRCYFRMLQEILNNIYLEISYKNMLQSQFADRTNLSRDPALSQRACNLLRIYNLDIIQSQRREWQSRKGGPLFYTAEVHKWCGYCNVNSTILLRSVIYLCYYWRRILFNNSANND